MEPLTSGILSLPFYKQLANAFRRMQQSATLITLPPTLAKASSCDYKRNSQDLALR
jgi:hypothetical protein